MKESRTPSQLKPRLFIGSASESKPIARKVQKLLEDDAEATIWDQEVFQLGDFTLERLLDILETFDFAVFILAPDDVANIRRQRFSIPRDNVVFELGLFLGRLGRNRCVVITRKEVKVPSDLNGLTLATYSDRQDNNLSAALSPACDSVRELMAKLGRSNPLADAAAKQLVEEFKNYLAANAVEKPTNLKTLSVSRLPSEPVSLIGESGYVSRRKTRSRKKR